MCDLLYVKHVLSTYAGLGPARTISATLSPGVRFGRGEHELPHVGFDSSMLYQKWTCRYVKI